jgi:hypothetical protein
MLGLERGPDPCRMVSMTRTSAELLLLAALVAAAGFTLSHSLRGPVPAGAGADRAAIVSAPVDDGLADRARHLSELQASPRPPVSVKRNPFAFASLHRVASAPVVRTDDAETAVPEAARADLTLSGIAEDQVAGAPVRTAVLVAAGKLLFAREGDRVLSRYVVVRIAADAVQLNDAERGGVFTLALK